MIDVAIAEDSRLFRKSFLRLMKAYSNLNFIIEAENGADLLLQMEDHQPDIVLLDIRMPVMDGFQATKSIKEQYPNVKIVAFTQFDIEENIVEMCRLGVKSFIGKDQGEDVPRILEIIFTGGVYYPDKVASILNESINRLFSPATLCPLKLSERELVLLQGMSIGLNRTELGKLLNKSPRTVELYRSMLYEKFKVHNYQQLLMKASQWSLIRSDRNPTV